MERRSDNSEDCFQHTVWQGIAAADAVKHVALTRVHARVNVATLRLQIRIKAFHSAAPKTSQLVTDLARRGGGDSLNLYRHEHAAKVQTGRCPAHDQPLRAYSCTCASGTSRCIVLAFKQRRLCAGLGREWVLGPAVWSAAGQPGGPGQRASI